MPMYHHYKVSNGEFVEIFDKEEKRIGFISIDGLLLEIGYVMEG